MKKRNLVYSITAAGLLMLLTNSCTKDEVVTGNPVQRNSVVKEALSASGIATYDGNTPPKLEGVYSTVPMQIYDATTIFSPYIGQNMSTIFKLSNQTSSGDISFAEQFSDGFFADGTGCFITGSGQNFTIWMQSSLSNGGATAFILSGTLDLASGNILNCRTITVYTVSTPSYSAGNWYAAQGWLQNTNNQNTTTGQAMFWTSRQDISPITVYINNSNAGIITVYSTGGLPDCGTTGFVTVDKSPGTYSFTASDGTHNWNGTITVTAGSCYKMQLL